MEVVTPPRLPKAEAGFGFGFRAMGGPCEIRLAAPNEATARSWAQAAIDEVRRIERKYSRYLPDSVVSRLAAAAGREAVSCDDETLALIAYADKLYRLSDGLFDITSGVLRRAWDFRSGRLPRATEVDALRPLIGWDKVVVEAKQVLLTAPSMELDFGGFGKEYAADRAAGALKAAGARHGFVNLGGDLNVIGPQADGRPWLIAIQDPRAPTGAVASLPLSAGGLATSGDYERFIEVGGRRYCHLLDPRSGWPVAGWRSVSVVAPLALAAGSMATIAMLKGSGTRQFLDDSGLTWLGIDGDGRLQRHDPVAAPRPRRSTKAESGPPPSTCPDPEWSNTQ